MQHSTAKPRDLSSKDALKGAFSFQKGRDARKGCIKRQEFPFLYKYNSATEINNQYLQML